MLVPGDREVSEKKLAKLYFPAVVRPFDDEDFARLGFAKGYVGPQGFGEDVTVLADHSVRGGVDWVTGANAREHHVTGANVGRDFRVDAWEDLVVIRDGDRCPVDGGELDIGRSIVVGHIYQLGTRYSAPLEPTFQDEDGTRAARTRWAATGSGSPASSPRPSSSITTTTGSSGRRRSRRSRSS